LSQNPKSAIACRFDSQLANPKQQLNTPATTPAPQAIALTLTPGLQDSRTCQTAFSKGRLPSNEALRVNGRFCDFDTGKITDAGVRGTQLHGNFSRWEAASGVSTGSPRGAGGIGKA
jgi:hypothetical protein